MSTTTLLGLGFWDLYRLFLDYDRRMPKHEDVNTIDQIQGELKEDVIKTVSMYLVLNTIVFSCLSNNRWEIINCSSYEEFLERCRLLTREMRDD